MHCLQNVTTEEVLSNHKKQFLLINGCQTVNYESGYADRECFLKRTNSYEGKYTIKYQEHFPNSIGAKLFLRLPKKLPIIFHNLEGYDGHLNFKGLKNFDATIDVIPKTMEKYMSIFVNRNIIFIDSLRFIKALLDTLTSNLEDNDFKYLMSEFPSDKLEILKRKDAYPYEWADS